MSNLWKLDGVFVVGLAGPSGSGKSTAARSVAAKLGGFVISMETYTAPADHLPLAERAKLDFDVPDALDIRLLETHVREYAAGKPISAPIYDFATHSRVAGRVQSVPAQSLLIVEGILALHFEELRPYFDLAIYLECPDETCFHRRKVRDITERQRPLDLILWQYENTVLPAAKRYLLPSKRYAQVVVNSAGDRASVEQALQNAIVQKNEATRQPAAKSAAATSSHAGSKPATRK
jgi:uridine kinase